MKTFIKRYLPLISVALAAAILAWSLYSWYGKRVSELEGEIRQVRSQREQIRAERDSAVTAARDAIQEAQRVAAEEARKREVLESRVRQREADNRALAGRLDALQGKLSEDVSEIPKQEDSELATWTVRRLKDAFPTYDPAITAAVGVFTANRPAVEASLRAALETIVSRGTISLKDERIANLQATAIDLEGISESLRSELTAERDASRSLDDENQARAKHEEALEKELALVYEQNKALKRRTFWQRLKPKFGVGVGVDLATGRPAAVGGIFIGW